MYANAEMPVLQHVISVAASKPAMHSLTACAAMQVLVKCQEVYCRKSCPTTPLALDTTAGHKLVITQIAAHGLQDVHAPFAPAAVLPGPVAYVDEGINKEPVIIQAPSPCLLQSYEDVGQAAFGDKGRAFITAVLYTELIGTCALFFILEVALLCCSSLSVLQEYHSHVCPSNH